MLEVRQDFFDVRIGILDSIDVLVEAGNDIKVFECFAARLEEVDGVVNVGLLERLVLFFLLIVACIVVFLELSSFKLALVLIEGLLALLLLNQLVVEILQVPQVGNDSILVILLTGLTERIVLDLEDFEVVAQLMQVLDRVFQIGNGVGSDGKYVELLEVVETFNNDDTIGEEGEVLELAQAVQALDHLDHVKGEVEPLELGQRLQAGDLSDDVVVKLQLHEVIHAYQVADFNDILERERQMGQLPNLTIIVVEDLILAIVLNHVLADELVIDDSRPDRLLVLLNLLLRFEGRLNLDLHR